MPGEAQITISDLSFSYGNNRIFAKADARINRGDYVTILGPNGGGKSTLVKLLIGLLEPEGGKISINRMTPRAARPIIGYVPQYVNFDKLFPTTVMEAVLTGTLTRAWGFYSKQNRETAREVLEQVGLHEEGNRSFSEISGGQRQRALIARALASRPQILILDEPTSSVDSEVERNFRELLTKLNKSLTILMITHDFGFVDKDVSRVLCINHNIVEHPADGVSSDLISASYGRTVKPVHHDLSLHSHGPHEGANR